MTDSQVIGVINGKGGVGKTSVTTNVAGIIAAAGYPTLVIDCDPQGHCRLDLGYEGDEGAGLLTAGLSGTRPAITTGVRDHLDVIPGGYRLAGLTGALDGVRRTGRGGPNTLTEAIRSAAEGYDFALIDCPPGEPVIQEAVLAACRWVLIPVKSDEGSLDGLRMLADRFVVARQVNPALDVLGVFLFGVSKGATAVAKSARKGIREVLGIAADPEDDQAPVDQAGGLPSEILFKATIRHVERTAFDSRSRGRLAHELQAMLESGPSRLEVLRRRRAASGGGAGSAVAEVPDIGGSAGSLADDYYALTEEILRRIAHVEGRTQGTER